MKVCRKKQGLSEDGNSYCGRWKSGDGGRKVEEEEEEKVEPSEHRWWTAEAKSK